MLLICAGVVLGAEALKPISWRVWAGKMEREGGGPFKGLEERRGFVDIRVSSWSGFLSFCFGDIRREGDGEVRVVVEKS